MSEQVTICWTPVVSVLTRYDLFEAALGLFCEMGRRRRHGLCPDAFTFGTVLTLMGTWGD